jgi:hypothetical protein
MAGSLGCRRERTTTKSLPASRRNILTPLISQTPPVNRNNAIRICELALRYRIAAVCEISDWAKCGDGKADEGRDTERGADPLEFRHGVHYLSLMAAISGAQVSSPRRWQQHILLN